MAPLGKSKRLYSTVTVHARGNETQFDVMSKENILRILFCIRAFYVERLQTDFLKYATAKKINHSNNLSLKIFKSLLKDVVFSLTQK